MALAIFLRKRLIMNWFRDLMIGAIQTGAGKRALLCSGFFQENGYKATQEKQFAQVLFSQGIDLTTVGIHTGIWKTSYSNFINNLKAANVNVNAKYVNGLKWHAKVFILSNNYSIFGIIGSSNITRPAFAAIKNFNYECDVILWPDDFTAINDFMIEALRKIDDYHEVIIAPYEEKNNGGITIVQRLKKLEEEILSLRLSDLM
jgi:hypothetical protein